MVFWKRKSAEISKEDIQYREGFDNPLSPIESDLLARQMVTNQVYAYLTNLNPEWSVRVGLIAPWGEGKTTVCRWVAARALKDGHIPVWWSNPWVAKTDAEL